jgi:Delta3-Delta2-enoyl-CoA isomerase
MLPYFKIGLNEAPVGIVAPDWVMATAKNVLPTRTAERILTTGRLFETQEAFDMGTILHLLRYTSTLIFLYF